MDFHQAARNPEAYAHWINQRLGAEVRRRCERLGISAYSLAEDAQVSDQTFLNIERGQHSPTITTLAFVSVRFGTPLVKLVLAAEPKIR